MFNFCRKLQFKLLNLVGQDALAVRTREFPPLCLLPMEEVTLRATQTLAEVVNVKEEEEAPTVTRGVM